MQEDKSGEINASLSQIFMDYSEEHQEISQIRYLDLSGQEIVRVNRLDDISITVPPAKLQNKSDRYYYKELYRLSQKQVFYSPMDLNIEHGVIQNPLQKTIRIGTSIYDAEGYRSGWLLVNISADHILTAFRESSDSMNSELMLLNSVGYYLEHPNQAENWNLLNEEHSFSADYVDLWQSIDETESGQLSNKIGLFSYTTLFPFPNQDYYWKVISFVPNDKIEAMGSAVLSRNMPVYLLLLVLSIVATGLITFYRLRFTQAQLEKEYAKSYRNILQDIDLLAVSLDDQGNISYCNDHFLHKLNLRDQDIVGRSFSHLIPVDDPSSIMLAEAFKTNEPPDHFHGNLVTKDGVELIIDWSVTLTQDKPIKKSRLTLLGKDITTQLAIEEELRTLSRAVEQSASTVMITNAAAEIQYVNPKFTQLTGYSADEVKGKNPRFLQSGETSKAGYKKLWDKVLSGGEWRGEFHNKKKNGELYWEHTTISQIKNQEGETTHYLAVKEDLTEQKRLAAEAKERDQEIMKNRELAVVGRIANMIAHDLRNPLSSVKMSLQILGKGQHDVTEKEELVTISLDQVRYMENMISDLLSYSRQSDLKPTWLSIDKLLDNAVSVTQKAITTQNVTVKTEYHTGLPTMFGDRTKLLQVFSNLILNAVQATENNGNRKPIITIKASLVLSSEGTNIQVEIQDNGSGIDDETISKLYEPFFTTRAKGTGLGLAIVRSVIKRHAGTISLSPGQLYGTSAMVILPTNALSDEKDRLEVAI